MLRCTGRANPDRPVPARPRRPAGPHRALPGPRLPRFLLLRRRRASARRRPRVQRRLRLDLRRGRRQDPGRSRSCRSRRTPTGCRSRRSSRCRSSRSSGPTAIAAALPFASHRRARGAAGLGDRARGGARAALVRSARASSRRSPPLSSCSWPSPTTSRSTSRSSRARLARRPRAEGPPALVRDRRPARRPGDARRATTACSSAATLGLAFLWDRWRAWRSRRRAPAGDPALGGRRLRRPVRRRHGAVVARQLAVFGSISPSTASGKVLFIRTIEEWNSITTPATLDHLLGQGIGPLLLSRIGGLVAAVGIFTTLHRRGPADPSMVIGAWARRRLGRLRAVLRLRVRSCSRSRRSCRRSTSRAARSSTPRSRSRPTPTSSRSRASRSASAGSRPGDARGTARRRPAIFVAAAVGLAVVAAVAR